jgi:integrase
MWADGVAHPVKGARASSEQAGTAGPRSALRAGGSDVRRLGCPRLEVGYVQGSPSQRTAAEDLVARPSETAPLPHRGRRSWGLRTHGCSEKTAAEALATLHSIVRFAIRSSWIGDNPVAKLEGDERPHPTARRQRVLGRDEIGRLLAACLSRYQPLLATALYSGLRISELLGLVWDDVDLAAGVIHVRAQLSRAHRGVPARRVAPKTPAAIRDVPLVPQLAEVLREHRRGSAFNAGSDWVFATGRGTPLGHRNVERRALRRAARTAALDGGGWPPLRFHDLRTPSPAT